MKRDDIRKLFLKTNQRIGEHILLLSVRRGLAYMIPLILPGSIALIFLSLPVPAYQHAMNGIFGEGWSNVFLYVRDGTFNILSLIMTISIGYAFANEYSDRHQYVSPLITSTVALSSFVALIGINKEGFTMENFGVVGIFMALVVGIFSSLIFIKLCTIKFLNIKAYTDGADSTFNYAISAILPAAFTVGIFAALNQLLDSVFNISDVRGFLSGILENFFSSIDSSFFSALLFIFLIHVFWIFGMHGSNILETVAQKFFVPGLSVNHELAANGLSGTEIFTKTFFDTFVLMGGCGTSLCLLFAILIAGRRKNGRRLAKISFVPVLFNINELIIFGLPVVLNPIFIIPFLGVPLVLTIFSYLAMSYGIIPVTINQVEWTTPILLSGFSATGSLRGSLLQIVNLGIGIACYIPFVRLSESLSDMQVRTNLDKVYAVFSQEEERGMATSLLSRQDEIGMTSRFFLAEMENDLLNRRMEVFYQPQVDYHGSVIGMEALLRWHHSQYGLIYPPLAIALAEEAGLIDSLGEWIINRVCTDIKKMHELEIYIPSVSVNISVIQLEDSYFTDKLKLALEKNDVKPHELEIEITERIALTGGKKIHLQMLAIKDLGVHLAMDDFGMGHSSLLYLKEGYFNTVKLDGFLTRELLVSDTCRNIVSSIAALGRSLDYSLIAEYVETEEQKMILHDLGCDNYQGYLYSEAVPFQEIIKFIKQHMPADRDLENNA